jgi:hypothetical protein
MVGPAHRRRGLGEALGCAASATFYRQDLTTADQESVSGR